MSESNYYVYALLGEDGVPFYIGASQDPARYDHHCYSRNPVVVETRSRGIKPELKVIMDELSKVEALDMERAIIAGIGLDRLTNGNGGIGKVTISKEEWLRAGGCRDARTLLGWSMADLAKTAAVDLWKVIAFNCGGTPSAASRILVSDCSAASAP
jgi:hypothetical protein